MNLSVQTVHTDKLPNSANMAKPFPYTLLIFKHIDKYPILFWLFAHTNINNDILLLTKQLSDNMLMFSLDQKDITEKRFIALILK